MLEIHQAGDQTKEAVNKVTEELQSLLKMFVDELESMDGKYELSAMARDASPVNFSAVSESASASKT